MIKFQIVNKTKQQEGYTDYYLDIFNTLEEAYEEIKQLEYIDKTIGILNVYDVDIIEIEEE